jgi:hypothetical protein
MKASLIIEALKSVTNAWTKQRKAEERNTTRALRRREALIHTQRVSVKAAAREQMEQAYLQASTGGKYPAHARQIMYAARPAIQEATGEMLNDKYFTQTLLPDYLIENPLITREWDVVFDARGHFREPHTDVEVPLGTLDVRDYLRNLRGHTVGDINVDVLAEKLFPTWGPVNRFNAVLFIEKEGFLPLFRAVKLAERYDLAIMSTKGMSVTASRKLVDAVCGGLGVPLLVLHDFDKSGFSILGTLTRSGRRYEFSHSIQVIDLGLRLEDVQKYGLTDETAVYGRKNPVHNLRHNGATDDEIEFLCGQSDWTGYSGRRVELNAFSSGDLIAFIEEKLERHGIKKVVPDSETLTAAYRRALTLQVVSEHLQKALEIARGQAESAAVPKDLSCSIRRDLNANPARTWDDALAKIMRARRRQDT